MERKPGPGWAYEDQVTVTCVNFHPVGKNRTATLKKIKDFTMEAACKEANIIVFPEIALGNFYIPPEVAYGKAASPGKPPSDMAALAETIPGPSTEEIAALATRHHVYVIFGMIEKDRDKFYNAAAVVAPSGKQSSYRKVHYRAPWEIAWLTRGDSFPLFSTPYGPFGIGICYESYCMPEVARSYAVRGSRLFINITAFAKFPDCRDYLDFYLTTLGCRSVENQMFVASADAVGKLGGLSHLGKSVILGPKPGYMSYQVLSGPASGTEEEIITATLDLKSIDKMPYAVADICKDRKPEAYHYLVSPHNNRGEGFSDLSVM